MARVRTRGSLNTAQVGALLGAGAGSGVSSSACGLRQSVCAGLGSAGDVVAATLCHRAHGVPIRCTKGRGAVAAFRRSGRPGKQVRSAGGLAQCAAGRHTLLTAKAHPRAWPWRARATDPPCFAGVSRGGVAAPRRARAPGRMHRGRKRSVAAHRCGTHPLLIECAAVALVMGFWVWRAGRSKVIDDLRHCASGRILGDCDDPCMRPACSVLKRRLPICGGAWALVVRVGTSAPASTCPGRTNV